MEDVQGQRVPDIMEAKEIPGAFWWHGDPPIRLAFVCPCGCGSVGGVAVAVDMNDRGGRHPVWTWNGSLDKPTLSPSILFTSGCRWHGHLVDGVFKPC